MVAGTSLRRRVAPWAIDAGLAVLTGAGILIAIRLAEEPGARPPDAFAYGLGMAVAAFVLARRRWPLAVLLASTVTLQTYYFLDYPGISPAVPLAVALATATAAGHLRWALLVAGWYVVAPILFRTLVRPEPILVVLGDAVPIAVLLGAVILLGDSIRSRRALDREHRLLRAEREKSERLLRNVLPGPIAERLKDRPGTIAEEFSDATVLFADIVGFTGVSERVGPRAVVAMLNELFSTFDDLAAEQGLEKIKTIGDAYVVAGGLPEPRADHAEAVAELALGMRARAEGRVTPDGNPLRLRIGMDTGPVAAGVIGRNRFVYDLWGDTVNTASRMESTSAPGCIQVSDRVYERLWDRFRFEPREPIDVKGKGQIITYFLVGRNDEPGSS